MSQENVEVVRRSVELWSMAEWDALGTVIDPNVVVLPPEGWPDGEIRTGLDAWIKQSIQLKEAWETDELLSDEAREVGDSVVIRLHWTTKGRGSGIGVDTEFWGVYTLLANKIVRMAFFFDRARALKAAGLSEQDAHADS
jgi:ketosteroid isomerase-like protein